MQNNKTTLTSQELAVIQDNEFLLLKRTATDKVIEGFAQLREHIDRDIQNHAWEDLIPYKPGDVKISRGENYKGLPYVILDYPRQFSFQDIFAFRTMFWWGHFFSYTLHLQGQSYEKYKTVLKKVLSNSASKLEGLYIGVGKHPWDYHYEKDNYLPLDSLPSSQIEQVIDEREFVKISTYSPLQADLEPVIEEGSRQFRKMMGLIFG